MVRVIYILVFIFSALNSYAWNAAGHKVVAQIAFDNLSPAAQTMCHKYLPGFQSAHLSFIASSTWMDQLRAKKIYWYDAMHYISIPFSDDGTKLPSVKKVNAVWAIKNAIPVFIANNTNYSDKSLALRILIHVIADVHQPLHAATRVSSGNPNGDAGGNLFPLGKNSVGNNLHYYWDNGAGFFLGTYNTQKIKKTAEQLERTWPCTQMDVTTNPSKWAKKAHGLALKNAYIVNPYEIPSKKYQANAQLVVKKQAAFAGCRLAALLNQLAQIR